MTDTLYIDLDLACGTYRFALPPSAQMEIERICQAPFGAVAARVMRGRFSVRDDATTGLITQAEFGALDLDMIIRKGLIAGGGVTDDAEPGVLLSQGDVDGWFAINYLNKWSIEQKWTVAAAVIGAMFHGYPAAANLPKAADAKAVGKKPTAQLADA